MTALRHDSIIHDFVPIFAGQYLKNGQQSDRERIEIRWWRPVREIELATKQLHSQKGKDQNEQEEKEQQRYNRSHGVE